MTVWRFWERSRDADGLESAFERLTRPHIGGLWRTALRMTGDRSAADELTQEACLKAYAAFDRFETGTNYRAWLFRILINLCTDHLRRQRTAGTHVPMESVGDLPADPRATETGSPEVALIRKEFQNAVLEALRGLSPEIRMVVSLALIEGHSYQEIAEIAHCPVGTVRSRLSRGRQHLQRALEDHAGTREGTRQGSLRVVEDPDLSAEARSTAADPQPQEGCLR